MKINPKAQRIIELLEMNGFEAYVVGGCVRDSLLNREPKDWDITTNALPEQMVQVFIDYHTIPTGLKHGTITIVVEDEQFEVTTYRIDGQYSDCRRPDDVKFTTSVIEDLARRDFTINAIAYNQRKGYIDPFSGEKDLKDKVIRAVGNPTQRYQEDALRMMRCIRFACQLGFSINRDTINSVLTNSSLIEKISIERIREEMNKIIISNHASWGIGLLNDTELLWYFLPEVCNLVGFDQHNPHHHKNVFDHTMTVLDSVPNSLVLRWSALLHDIGKPASFTIDENNIGHFYEHHKIGADISRDVLRRLKFDNDTIEKIGVLVYNHMSRYDFLRAKSIKKFINRVGVNNLNDLFELQIADIKGSKPPHDFYQVQKLRDETNRILNEKEPLTIKDLAINGNDLINIGYKQGKELGDILRNLLEEVLKNPELNNKSELLRIIGK